MNILKKLFKKKSIEADSKWKSLYTIDSIDGMKYYEVRYWCDFYSYDSHPAYAKYDIRVILCHSVQEAVDKFNESFKDDIDKGYVKFISAGLSHEFNKSVGIYE